MQVMANISAIQAAISDIGACESTMECRIGGLGRWKA